MPTPIEDLTAREQAESQRSHQLQADRQRAELAEAASPVAVPPGVTGGGPAAVALAVQQSGVTGSAPVPSFLRRVENEIEAEVQKLEGKK